MPNGVYPVPRFRAASEPTRRSLGRRVSVWLHRVELDEQLAAGAQPSAGSLLHERAEQLSSVGARGRLASSLAETLNEARRPRLLIQECTRPRPGVHRSSLRTECFKVLGGFRRGAALHET